MYFYRYNSASYAWLLSFFGVFILPLTGCEDKVSEHPVPVENQAVPDDYDARITYCRDVDPILDQHCAVCHHNGGSAPFVLVTYDDAKSRAEQLVDVTESQYMPPWLPDPTYSHFSGERWLRESDIGTIYHWVLLGAHEGNRAHGRSPPKFTNNWQLGEPDLVIEMLEVYELEAEGTDVFCNLVMPVPVTEIRYVVGFEFRPGNVSVVHHAGVLMDAANSARIADARDNLTGYDGMQRTNAQMPGGHMLDWIPGKTPFTTSPERAWRLEPGFNLVFELHLQPSSPHVATLLS